VTTDAAIHSMPGMESLSLTVPIPVDRLEGVDRDALAATAGAAAAAAVDGFLTEIDR
jgi:hypothetical protein